MFSSSKDSSIPRRVPSVIKPSRLRQICVDICCCTNPMHRSTFVTYAATNPTGRTIWFSTRKGPGYTRPDESCKSTFHVPITSKKLSLYFLPRSTFVLSARSHSAPRQPSNVTHWVTNQMPPSILVISVDTRLFGKMLWSDIDDSSTNRFNYYLDADEGYRIRKPRTCDVCQKTFGNHSLLKRHLLVHRSDSPLHRCILCGRKSIWKDNIIKHIRLFHAVEIGANDWTTYLVSDDSLT